MSAIASLSAPLPSPARDAAPTPRALAGAVEGLLGPCRFVDLTAPSWSFIGAAEHVLIGAPAGATLPEAQRAFLSRFRQAGGRQPLFGVGCGFEEIWPALASQGDGVPVIVIASPDGLAAVAQAADRLGACVLLGTGTPARAQDARWLSGRSLVGLRPEGRDQPDHILALSPAAAAGLQNQGTGGPARGSRRKDAAPFLACDIVVGVPAQATDGRILKLPPTALIHDGGYPSETATDYSWLWTGPSRHFRMLVGGLPAGARLDVSVAKSEDHRNLDALRVLVDGRLVPHRLERWGASTGLVSATLPAASGTSPVVSIAYPHVVAVGDGDRKLGLCLSGLEVIP